MILIIINVHNCSQHQGGKTIERNYNLIARGANKVNDYQGKCIRFV